VITEEETTIVVMLVTANKDFFYKHGGTLGLDVFVIEMRTAAILP